MEETEKSVKKSLHLSRKIPNRKSDKRRIRNVFFRDFVRALEEERLIRWHFVEDNLLDRRFTAPVLNDQISSFAVKPYKL